MEQRMSVADAKKLLAEYRNELSCMGGVDKSGYLPFQIERLENAIAKFERGVDNGRKDE